MRRRRLVRRSEGAAAAQAANKSSPATSQAAWLQAPVLASAGPRRIAVATRFSAAAAVSRHARGTAGVASSSMAASAPTAAATLWAARGGQRRRSTLAAPATAAAVLAAADGSGTASGAELSGRLANKHATRGRPPCLKYGGQPRGVPRTGVRGAAERVCGCAAASGRRRGFNAGRGTN